MTNPGHGRVIEQPCGSAARPRDTREGRAPWSPTTGGAHRTSARVAGDAKQRRTTHTPRCGGAVATTCQPAAGAVTSGLARARCSRGFHASMGTLSTFAPQIRVVPGVTPGATSRLQRSAWHGAVIPCVALRGEGGAAREA